MAHIRITPENNGYDISVYQEIEGQETECLKTTWGHNKQEALYRANIYADFYTDDNGQRADIRVPPDWSSRILISKVISKS